MPGVVLDTRCFDSRLEPIPLASQLFSFSIHKNPWRHRVSLAQFIECCQCNSVQRHKPPFATLRPFVGQLNKLLLQIDAIPAQAKLFTGTSPGVNAEIESRDMLRALLH